MGKKYSDSMVTNLLPYVQAHLNGTRYEHSLNRKCYIHRPTGLPYCQEEILMDSFPFENICFRTKYRNSRRY